ncbi:MAG: hypothetical protein AAF997_21770 [Myxococcota bacterium]
MSQASSALRTTARLLTFQASTSELAALGKPELTVGLIATWMVGMGRWWDDPEAHLLQHLGVGSLAYTFALALLLWLLIKPLRPEHWTYAGVLTFVSLTSPPAILYAIPVERFMDLGAARQVNVWFLAFVAAWRVGLLAFYLRRLARLPWYAVLVATFLPLTVIVTVLAVLNLERAVFDVMRGLQEQGTAADEAYGVLLGLTALSTFLVGPFLLAYLFTWYARRSR